MIVKFTYCKKWGDIIKVVYKKYLDCLYELLCIGITETQLIRGDKFIYIGDKYDIKIKVVYKELKDI